MSLVDIAILILKLIVAARHLLYASPTPVPHQAAATDD